MEFEEVETSLYEEFEQSKLYLVVICEKIQRSGIHLSSANDKNQLNYDKVGIGGCKSQLTLRLRNFKEEIEMQ